MFCKFCGTQMNDGDLFCPNCGKQQTSETGNASSASITQTAQPQATVQTQPQAAPYIAKKSNAGVIGAVVGVVVVAAVLLGYMFVLKPQQEAKRIAEMQRLEAQRMEETKQKVAEFLRDLARKEDRPAYNEIADAVMKDGINTGIKNGIAQSNSVVWPPIYFTAVYGNVELTKALIDAGANINITFENGVSLFPLAAKIIFGTQITVDNAYKILKLFIDAGANINTGYPLIIDAILFGDTKIIKLLIDAGIDVDARSDEGVAALMYAVAVNSSEVVKLLIQAGANINARDSDGLTALIGAANRNSADVSKLLIDAGADINARDNDGWTALMATAEKNNTDVAKLLIDAGANVNVKNNYGWSALAIAEDQGFTQMAQMLRNAGATY